MFSRFQLNPIGSKYKGTYVWDRLQEVDVDHGIVFNFESNSQLCDMALDSVESRLLIVGSQNGFLHIFDVENPSVWRLDMIQYRLVACVRNKVNREESQSLVKESPLVCVQWYPVDSGAFISASVNKTLGIWDTNRLECVTSVCLSQSLSWLSMSSVACNHNLIAVSLGPGSEESCARAVLVDPLIGSTAITLLGGHSQSGLTQVVWSPRASYLVVTGGRDGKILYWDIRFPLKPIYSLNKEIGPQIDLVYSSEAVAHTGPVLGLTFSPDGLHLVSWGGSGLTLDAVCLRIWTSGPEDWESPSHGKWGSSNIPRSRPVNFGNVILNSSNNQFTNTRGQPSVSSSSSGRACQSPQPSILPVRLASTYGSTGDLWGASSLCAFVPVRNRLLIASASKNDSSTRVITRHFSKIRACVWNDRQLELYTCGNDGQLFTWPVHPVSSGNGNDDFDEDQL
ncbi:unnamed protein product [Heterobilharzia americana]|nr:unnamed protein product [Heterobilharzia americana]CAH8653734.1 unnamed protein product [Heterobilharzia americana]